MEGTALIYRPEQAPELTKFANAPPLAFLQEAVGGYIEHVPLFDTIEIDEKVVACRVYCNEEGKLNRLPTNRIATMLWNAALMRLRDDNGKVVYPTGLFTQKGITDRLVGTVIVLYGDDEFMGLV